MTGDKKTRRRYTELKKAQVLAECSEPGASVGSLPAPFRQRAARHEFATIALSKMVDRFR